MDMNMGMDMDMDMGMGLHMGMDMDMDHRRAICWGSQRCPRNWSTWTACSAPAEGDGGDTVDGIN